MNPMAMIKVRDAANKTTTLRSTFREFNGATLGAFAEVRFLPATRMWVVHVHRTKNGDPVRQTKRTAATPTEKQALDFANDALARMQKTVNNLK